MQKRQFLKSLVAVSLLAGGIGLAQADVLADAMKNGVLRVAVPQDFPPFGTVGPDLKPRGYDIDVANLIGRELKLKVEIIPVTSTNRIPYLTTGKADLVISSLRITSYNVCYTKLLRASSLRDLEVSMS